MVEELKTMGCEVMVAKADLPLIGEESIGDLQSKLDAALTEHFRGLKLEKKPRWLWISELYSEKVVVNIGWAEESRDELRAPDTFYRLSYHRSPGGAFTFGEVEEVERSTTWSSKGRVEKRLDDDFWKGVM